jgi:type IV secretory pathway VirB4 component
MESESKEKKIKRLKKRIRSCIIALNEYERNIKEINEFQKELYRSVDEFKNELINLGCGAEDYDIEDHE